MKIELEQQDLDAIAQKVYMLLKPILEGNKGIDEGEPIFTPETLAEYLKVDKSWIYKQVSSKTIPYFKSGKYTRFNKRDIEKWQENQTVRPVPVLKKLLKKVG